MAALDARAGGYRTVIDSAEHLLGVLPKGQNRIETAVDDLCRAVDSLDATASPVGRQRFDAAARGAAEPALPLDAALNEAAAQARIAQILFAASAAVGEEKDDPGADVLGDIVSAARSDTVVPLPVAQRFDAADAGISLPEAVKKLRQETNEALDRLVSECERTATGALSILGGHKDALLGAIGSIATDLQNSLPKLNPVFRLVARAWRWLLKSIASLQAIADQLPVEELKAKLEPILSLARPRTAIERALNVAEARTEIDDWRLEAPLGADAVVDARARVAALGTRFATAAENARLIQGILAGVAGLITMKLSGPMAPLVIPSVHVLIVASVVVLAIDYADANATVNFVKGIRQVGRELSQPADATHRQRA